MTQNLINTVFKIKCFNEIITSFIIKFVKIKNRDVIFHEDKSITPSTVITHVITHVSNDGYTWYKY